MPVHPYWDIDTMKYYKVPAHQGMQYREQTGQTRELCAVTGLCSHCDYGKVVGYCK